jgi:hypothetical protein
MSANVVYAITVSQKTLADAITAQIARRINLPFTEIEKIVDDVFASTQSMPGLMTATHASASAPQIFTPAGVPVAAPAVSPAKTRVVSPKVPSLDGKTVLIDIGDAKKPTARAKVYPPDAIARQIGDDLKKSHNASVVSGDKTLGVPGSFSISKGDQNNILNAFTARLAAANIPYKVVAGAAPAAAAPAPAAAAAVLEATTTTFEVFAAYVAQHPHLFPGLQGNSATSNIALQAEWAQWKHNPARVVRPAVAAELHLMSNTGTPIVAIPYGSELFQFEHEGSKLALVNAGTKNFVVGMIDGETNDFIPMTKEDAAAIEEFDIMYSKEWYDAHKTMMPPAAQAFLGAIFA